jgi:hypothetical protein
MHAALQSAIGVALLSFCVHLCNPNLPFDQKALVVFMLCAVVVRFLFVGSLMGPGEDTVEHAENRNAAMDAFKVKRFVPKPQPLEEADDVEGYKEAPSQGEWVEVAPPPAEPTDGSSS